MNKKKIFNDPVHGFINIPGELIFDLIEHPYFQRLRRIRQAGLTDYVYPGALHTRFQHAIGAMHLMNETMRTLNGKGYEISNQECQAALVAILLHDVGHGPFSHTLERSLLEGVPHEALSLRLMQALNQEFNGALGLALQIFTDQYPRRFFHQLVSSQLDMDRLDYLQRDSFFTGVVEGTIGADRIIKMLEVVDDQLVVQEKGIYSIENFLNARRLMYWQVYLHKTTISAEVMLTQTIRRAKELLAAGQAVFAPAPLALFLATPVTLADFDAHPRYLEAFVALDDHDLWTCLKTWQAHPDPVLSRLSRQLLERRLFKIILSTPPITADALAAARAHVRQHTPLPDDLRAYFVVEGTTSNAAYLAGDQGINILTKTGQIVDIAEASDLPYIKALSQVVRKNYVAWAR